jgi:hypothetical protein
MFSQGLCSLVHFIPLSDLFWLPTHAPCLLYYSSPQSYTVWAATLRVRHFPPKPLEELHRCSPSVCDHFVRDSARLPLSLTVTIQHRLLPRMNVSRMYAECFDKVFYHVNSRILKCKMTNVITRNQTKMHHYATNTWCESNTLSLLLVFNTWEKNPCIWEKLTCVHISRHFLTLNSWYLHLLIYYKYMLNFQWGLFYIKV